jgi:hypothetical protein
VDGPSAACGNTGFSPGKWSVGTDVSLFNAAARTTGKSLSSIKYKKNPRSCKQVRGGATLTYLLRRLEPMVDACRYFATMECRLVMLALREQTHEDFD